MSCLWNAQGSIVCKTEDNAIMEDNDKAKDHDIIEGFRTRGSGNNRNYAPAQQLPANYRGAKDTLGNNESLSVDERLVSSNGLYMFVMQADGNAVVYGPYGLPKWASGTANQPASRIVMQGDGNLVIYDDRNNATWACCLGRADGHRNVLANRYPGHAYQQPFRLVMQDDGNLIVYDGQNTPFWSSRG